MPTYIRTRADFEAAVILGTTKETAELEFKRELAKKESGQESDGSQGAQRETCRDISQFANSSGGCLLIGVAEAHQVASAIHPVADVAGAVRSIERAVVNYLVPSTFSYTITEIALDSGSILALNIPPSRHIVALWDRSSHRIEYLRRTAEGKTWMNPDEVERQIMNGSRAAQIALTQASEAADGTGHGKAVELIDGFRVEHMSGANIDRIGRPGPSVSLGEITGSSFTLKIIHQQVWNWTVSLPLSAVRDAWVTPKKRVGLLLDVVLVIPHDFQSGTDPIIQPRSK